MSTGKRLAKRSILGTRIVAPGQDGRFYPAVIQSVRPGDPVLAANNPRYTVRFDNSRKVIELPESELIGPGFSNINTSTQLMPGQRVYLTHGGREMEATILSHDNIRDEAIVNIGTNGLQLKVRLEDIRLLESRKSSRLMNQSTDFSKLADFNIVHERKRLNSEKSSDGSDFLGSRKRRGSETLSEEEERSSGDESGAGGRPRRGRRSGQRLRKERVGRGEEMMVPGDMTRKMLTGVRRSGSPVIMTECTAAMVLMDLSCSPANRGRMSHASGHSDASSGQMSPSSSGVSSLGTSWSCPSPTLTPPFPLPPTEDSVNVAADPVEALLQLAANGQQQCSLRSQTEHESDEGIVSDQSNEFDDKKTERVQTIYQCTWPGCSVRRDTCPDIERHVREKHLRRPAPARPEDDDHEEEFYYNEVEIPLHITSLKPQRQQQHQSVTQQQQQQQQQQQKTVVKMSDKTLVITSKAPMLSDHMDMARPPHENPEYTGRQLVTPGQYATIISSSGAALQWSKDGGSMVSPLQTSVDPAPVNLSTNTAGAVTSPAPGPVHAVPIAIPITTFTIASNQHTSPGKYIRLSPKPYSTSPKSPLRRPRGDAKKCRKVYGMEHRELWCTQCKWKKACTRFGETS